MHHLRSLFMLSTSKDSQLYAHLLRHQRAPLPHYTASKLYDKWNLAVKNSLSVSVVVGLPVDAPLPNSLLLLLIENKDFYSCTFPREPCFFFHAANGDLFLITTHVLILLIRISFMCASGLFLLYFCCLAFSSSCFFSTAFIVNSLIWADCASISWEPYFSLLICLCSFHVEQHFTDM